MKQITRIALLALVVGVAAPLAGCWDRPPTDEPVAVRHSSWVSGTIGVSVSDDDSRCHRYSTRYRDDDDDNDQPKTRVIKSSDGKRTYRYTSGK